MFFDETKEKKTKTISLIIYKIMLKTFRLTFIVKLAEENRADVE